MRQAIQYYLILFSPIPAIIISIFIGRYPLTKLFDLDKTAVLILLYIRLPRIILCGLTGAALSVSGASLQSTLRNPLVSPYILGLSQGAAFGTALAIVLLPYSLYTIYVIPVLAFTFGFLAILLTCFLARVRGNFSTITVVLAGIVVAAIFTALLSIVRLIADPYRLAEIVFWMMGSFYKASWDNLLIAAPGAMLGLVTLMLIRWRMNVLSMHDEEARLLGVNIHRERVTVMFLSTLSCASVISVSGIIAWIGLIIPHMARGIIGPDNKYLIPTSAALGATILILNDDLCRSLFTFEIPISILTTLVAAPYFIYLLKRVGGQWR